MSPRSSATRNAPADPGRSAGPALADRTQIADAVAAALANQPVTDVHTHLYPSSFGTPSAGSDGRFDPVGLMLWGIDELLTYHYLIAEVFRVVPSSTMPYEVFWRMPKARQAEHVWRHLFVERTPISEACRGVITTLTGLGLDPAEKDLKGYRAWFARQRPDGFVDLVMKTANVSSITMTNNVFDEAERRFWLADTPAADDPRFEAVVRLDPLLLEWPTVTEKLRAWGYEVTGALNDADADEGRRFLRAWMDRTGAIYCAASLPPEFAYPDGGTAAGGAWGVWALEQIVLPVCAERGLPLALMIGARRGVNPGLGDAGDGLGCADVTAVANLCDAFPRNKFLVTMLSRENQHELAVTARKFDNLMIFGCWWFVNTPSLIEEITRMRLELLGTSFIPQHSDARVLDQLVYKWQHSRAILGKVLTDKYADLHAAAWPVTTDEIARDVRLLLKDNFAEFLAR